MLALEGLFWTVFGLPKRTVRKDLVGLQYRRMPTFGSLQTTAAYLLFSVDQCGLHEGSVRGCPRSLQLTGPQPGTSLTTEHLHTHVVTFVPILLTKASHRHPHLKRERNCFQKEGNLEYWSTVETSSSTHDETSWGRLLTTQV